MNVFLIGLIAFVPCAVNTAVLIVMLKIERKQDKILNSDMKIKQAVKYTLIERRHEVRVPVLL